MSLVEIYGRSFCPKVGELSVICGLAGIPFVVRDTWAAPAVEAELARRSPPSMETPQVFVGDVAVGGYRDFIRAFENCTLQQIIGGR